jgi:hypothetical protein
VVERVAVVEAVMMAAPMVVRVERWVVVLKVQVEVSTAAVVVLAEAPMVAVAVPVVVLLEA